MKVSYFNTEIKLDVMFFLKRDLSSKRWDVLCCTTVWGKPTKMDIRNSSCKRLNSRQWSHWTRIPAIIIYISYNSVLQFTIIYFFTAFNFYILLFELISAIFTPENDVENVEFTKRETLLVAAILDFEGKKHPLVEFFLHYGKKSLK